MAVAGIDYSTRAVDIVLLDEDSDAATWHRVTLQGNDAFERARDVRAAMVEGCMLPLFDDVLAVGIEDPRGYGSGSLYRIQGAVLACLPKDVLVHPLIPSQWRKTVGLPGNADKDTIRDWVNIRRLPLSIHSDEVWPQDACDAYCIALATRTLIEKVAA